MFTATLTRVKTVILADEKNDLTWLSKYIGIQMYDILFPCDHFNSKLSGNYNFISNKDTKYISM